MSERYKPRAVQDNEMAAALYAARDCDLRFMAPRGSGLSGIGLTAILMKVVSCEKDSGGGMWWAEEKALGLCGFNDRRSYERNMNALVKTKLVIKQRRPNTSTVYRINHKAVIDLAEKQHYTEWCLKHRPDEALSPVPNEALSPERYEALSPVDDDNDDVTDDDFYVDDSSGQFGLDSQDINPWETKDSTTDDQWGSASGW